MQEREVKKEALIKTMTFFDIFDMPLTKEEACDFILYKNLTLMNYRNSLIMKNL